MLGSFRGPELSLPFDNRFRGQADTWSPDVLGGCFRRERAEVSLTAG